MNVLNIGLDRNDKAGHVNTEQVIQFLRSRGLGPVLFGIHQSDTEPTMIVGTVRPVSEADLWHLCEHHAQDCIAQFDGAEGSLVGPKAEAWGPFNPKFFITAEGKRLA